MSHPYRSDDARQALPPEIDGWLRWYRVRWWWSRIANAIVPAAIIAACIALGRVHWAGWILLGTYGALMAATTVAMVLSARTTSRFEQRLRSDPGQLLWLHVEAEPARGKECACDMLLRDGTSWAIYIGPDMARSVAEVAAAWPFRVTQSREAYDAYRVECELRRVADRLRRADSALAEQLAPHVLRAIDGRSCADVPASRLANLKAALNGLDILLAAATRYEAVRDRGREANPQLAKVLDAIRPDSPYSEEATSHVRAIERAFSAG